jgi:hypothetical protein
LARPFPPHARKVQCRARVSGRLLFPQPPDGRCSTGSRRFSGMEKGKRVGGKLVESRAEALLAKRSSMTEPGRRGIAGPPQEESAEPAMLAVDAVRPAGVPTLVVTPHRGAGLRILFRGSLTGALCASPVTTLGAHAGQAAHNLGRHPLIDRIALRLTNAPPMNLIARRLTTRLRLWSRCPTVDGINYPVWRKAPPV